MITNFLKQTKHSLSSEYHLLNQEEELIGSAEIPFAFKTKIKVNYAAQNFYVEHSIREGVRSLFTLGENAKLVPFTIENEREELIGGLCRRKKGGMFKGYHYYEMVFNQQTYYIYVIGLGKEGLKIPVYQAGGKQISLIEKGTITLDNLDEYEITSVDSNHVLVPYLFALYYDATEKNNEEIAAKKKEYSIKITLSKELKSFYDPTFKK